MAELDCYFSMVFKPRQEASRNKQPRLGGRDDEVHVSAGAAAAGDRPSVGAATVMEQDDSCICTDECQCNVRKNRPYRLQL